MGTSEPFGGDSQLFRKEIENDKGEGMKAIKFHVDKALWERFFRLFPGHGERSGILRKVVRNIVSLSDSHISLAERVSDSVWEDLLGEGEKDE